MSKSNEWNQNRLGWLKLLIGSGNGGRFYDRFVEILRNGFSKVFLKEIWRFRLYGNANFMRKEDEFLTFS